MAGRRNQKYDVSLLFRGTDTRSFVHHIYSKLAAEKFAVFMDCDIPIGEPIGPVIFGAIHNSKIAIIIISKRSGESLWCMLELTMIKRRAAEQGLLVYPILYEVDASDVRDQAGLFGEFFHELVRQHMLEEREWNEALQWVVGIGRWTYVANGNPARLVIKVFEKVESELRKPWIERFPLLVKYSLCSSWKKRRESKCQVFVSCGPAIEKAWAANLGYSLEREKIRVFTVDDPSLIGKVIDQEIRNAIHHCEIFILIISEDYLSSSRCLDSLTQIVRCYTTNGQKIFPIFYKVNPSRVREVSYLLHMVPPGEFTREEWRQSLLCVASLEGSISENIDGGNDGQLVKGVVREVVASLKNPNCLIRIC